MNLKDLAEPLPRSFQEAIEVQLLAEVRSYADGRMSDVSRGAETPELAAVLLEKFGWGMSRAAHIIGVDSGLMAEIDRLAREIDPDFEAHRASRWAARPASLSTTPGTKA